MSMKITAKGSQDSKSALPIRSYFSRTSQIRDGRWIMSSTVVETNVGCLEEEVGEQCVGVLVAQSRQWFYFVDETAKKHGLARTRTTLNPEHPVLLIAPLPEIGVIEDLAV
ncbi:hypothetical protein CFAM422_003547 [Trichoderma lentiforme]|uniref:Uncharacterized protein n=1 Tax=Trichoderma lentiforme TaxID=1567552 RepID=A0A9P5CE13_9HYPO|nr:hypothetical protein CFAM422_003547 [Trichoderma lentiforme]